MKIGWSNLALKCNKKGAGHSYFLGTNDELLKMVHENWDKRIIGNGAKSIDDVCIVPVDPIKFVSGMIPIEHARNITAKLMKRQDHEEPFVRVEADGPELLVKYAKVVLYARHELLKNNEEVSGDFDWEVVCLIATDCEDEEMMPLAMARNQLNKKGGTPRWYPSEQWAAAVWYWSRYVFRRAEK